MNTPHRIARYSERIPWLAFLKKNGSVMLEYGYAYDDPHVGIFRSRLTLTELKKNDEERGEAAAGILNRFQDKADYRKFLEDYSPITNPFVHEAGVHLYRRNLYFARSMLHRDDPKKYAKYLTIAFRENQIMEKYFPNTLRYSVYRWSTEKADLARKHHLKNEKYDSPVSRSLVTSFTERQLVWVLGLLLVSLTFLQWYLGKGARSGAF
jgi:hypothetical protein